MVVDIALGIGSTVAGVDTVPVVARLSLGTVVVCLAADDNRFRLCTGNPWVSDIPIGATTDRFMILNSAESICCTWIGNSTGVETLSVDTGCVWRTFRVISAFWC